MLREYRRYHGKPAIIAIIARACLPPLLACLTVTATAGCMTNTPAGAETLPAGSLWQLAALNGESVGTGITLRLDQDGGIGGNAGCNRYFGTAAVDDGTIAITGVGSTRRACSEPGVMQLEQQYLAALGEVERYALGADVSLRLFSGNNAVLLEFRRVPDAATTAGGDGNRNGNSDNAIAFDCPQLGSISVRFTPSSGAELELPGDAPVVLTQVQSASGARYDGPDGLSFHSKGAEALLDVRGETYRCRQISG